jgi:copper chaperone
MTYISIPDMHCGHCKTSVEAALAAVPGTGKVEVDLTTRRARVSDAANPAAMLLALDAIGFPAAVLPG